MVTENTSERLDIKLSATDKCLTGADGSVLDVIGSTNVCIKGTYKSVMAPVYVLRGSNRNLLGLPEIRRLNLLAVVNALRVSEFRPTEEYPELSKGLSTLPGVFKIQLKSKAEPRCLYSPRTIAAGLRDKA